MKKVPICYRGARAPNGGPVDHDATSGCLVSVPVYDVPNRVDLLSGYVL